MINHKTRRMFVSLHRNLTGLFVSQRTKYKRTTITAPDSRMEHDTTPTGQIPRAIFVNGSHEVRCTKSCTGDLTNMHTDVTRLILHPNSDEEITDKLLHGHTMKYVGKADGQHFHIHLKLCTVCQQVRSSYPRARQVATEGKHINLPH